MTDLRKAAEMALDALENHTAIKHPQQIQYRDDAIEALRQALAQPKRAWVPLTDADLKEAKKACHGEGPSYRFAYWVEAICKEKNT